MLDTITPPAAKIGGAPEPAETVTTQETTTTVESGKRKGALETIGERADAAVRDEKVQRTQADKVEADKRTAAATAAAADDSDEALNKEIEASTKNWQPGEKKAFTKKTYENRDLKRQLKDFETKNAEAETLRTKVAEYEKQLTTQQAKGPVTDTKQIDELTEKIKTLTQRAEAAEQTASAKEQELAVTAVEKSEEYRKAVTVPREAIENKVKELAKKYEMPERIVLAALHGTSDEQVEAAASFNEADKIAFYSLATKVGDLNERAEVLRVNAKEALEKISANRAQEAETETKTNRDAREAAHSANWKALQEAVPVLTPAEGDDPETKTWNQHIADAEKFSKETDFGSLEAPQQSKVLQRAAVFPMLVGALGSYQAQIVARDAKIVEQAAEIAKFRGSKPGAEITTRETTTTEESAVTKGKTDFVDRVGARLKEAGL